MDVEFEAHICMEADSEEAASEKLLDYLLDSDIACSLHKPGTAQKRIEQLHQRIEELEARLEEEQLSRRDCIPVIQANKDIHKAVELAETMLRKRIEELEADLKTASSQFSKHQGEWWDKEDKLEQRIRKLEDMLFAVGRMEKSPCFVCGYSGPNYYRPDIHPCAKRHHALKGKGSE